jgi:hypothetical protein
MQKPIKVGLCHSLQNSFKSTKPACLSAYQSFFDPLHSAWLTVSIGGGRVAGGCAGGGMGLVSSWGLRTPLWACWPVTGVQWVAELALVDGTHLGMAPLSLWASGVASMLFSVHPALVHVCDMVLALCQLCGGWSAGMGWGQLETHLGSLWPLLAMAHHRSRRCDMREQPVVGTRVVVVGSKQATWEWLAGHFQIWAGLGCWAPRVGRIYLHNAHERIMCDQI